MTLSVVSAIISETWLARGVSSFNLACTHPVYAPRFDASACQYLPASAVAEKYPRVSALCNACGQQVRMWASLAHMQALGET